jgi:MFS family permease
MVEPGGPRPIEAGARASDRYRVLAGSCIGSFFNISTIIIYCFGVFAVGIAEELGVTRLAATKLIGPALLLTIVAQPAVGLAIDRWPRRNVALTAIALLAIAPALIAIAPAEGMALTLVITVAVALSCLASPGIYNAYLSDSFTQRRGLAMGVSAAFTGLGIAALPVIAGSLVASHGWREAYLIFAVMIALAFVVNLLLFPRVDSAVRRDPVIVRDVLRATLRRPVFWLLAVIFFLIPITVNSLPIYLPLILSQRGASAELSAAGMSAVGISMVISRPILGFLIDRFAPWKVVVGMMAGPLIGSLALLIGTGVQTGFMAAVGFGIGIGGEFVALGFLVARIFGLRNFGLVYGWLSMAVACGVALGPIIVGALARDTDFSRPLLLIAAVAVLAMLLSVGLRAEAER